MNMSDRRRFPAILIPCATVFVSSACIMILELVGGRLVARDLGASLYTWTSIIGVVLLGISAGNYCGGLIADRAASKNMLALLFAASSAACGLTVLSNNLVGGVAWLTALNWPARVVTHIALVFFIPSMLLGTIGPVVAKRALDHTAAAGRTIGDLYAWGAVGSIVGTFLTGFYLIARFGTMQTIWGVGAVLLLMAIFHAPRSWLLHAWAAVFIGLMALGALRARSAAAHTPASPGLRGDPRLLYEAESAYNYIAVRRVLDVPDVRSISFNNAIASNRVNMDDVRDLRDPYMGIYAAATSLLAGDGGPLSVLVLGGGGYVYPRYVEQVWPQCRIDVVEIDPGVTVAAVAALGLSEDTALNVLTVDGRNYVDGLLEAQAAGRDAPRYDFVYGDAFNDFAVPWQMVTRQFNDKIAAILAEDGVYMLNVLDMVDSGRFLAALANTLGKTFASLVIVSQAAPHGKINSFVLIAGKAPLRLDGLRDHEMLRNLRLEIWDGPRIDALAAKAPGMVLADNYSPVENLLAPAVVRACARKP
jgi:spermidine synthase